MIVLRFITETWNLQSALIRIGTRSIFSHCEYLDTDTGVTLGARNNRYSYIPAGVQMRPSYYCKPSLEQWWTAPDIEASYEEGKQFIGQGYDDWDIAGIVVNKPWFRPEMMICSRFLWYSNLRAWAKMNAVSWLNPNQPSCHCVPDTLLWSPFLSRVK